MVKIYTDGSCSGNGEEKNFGGMGVVVTKNDKIVKEYSIKDFNTTNNRTEIKAVIYAIEIAKILNRNVPQEILIFSDSAYTVNIINDWMGGWQKRGWKKGDGKEPENLDLVRALYDLMHFERAIKVKKIKGHSGHEFNDRADELATQGTEAAKKESKNENR